MNQEEKDRIDEVFKICKELMIKKSIEYGDIWKEDNLGHKATFVELSAKHGRLKKLVWDNNASEDTINRIGDTLIDMIDYCVLTIMLLDKDFKGKIELEKMTEYAVGDKK